MAESSIKINLSANAVRSLLADHPDVLIELTQKASAQVSEMLTRRWNQQSVNEVVARIDGAINAKLSQWQYLPNDVKAAVVHTLESIVITKVDQHVSRMVNEAVTKNINLLIQTQSQHVADLVTVKALELVDKKINARVNALLSVAEKFNEP